MISQESLSERSPILLVSALFSVIVSDGSAEDPPVT